MTKEDNRRCDLWCVCPGKITRALWNPYSWDILTIMALFTDKTGKPMRFLEHLSLILNIFLMPKKQSNAGMEDFFSQPLIEISRITYKGVKKQTNKKPLDFPFFPSNKK